METASILETFVPSYQITLFIINWLITMAIATAVKKTLNLTTDVRQ